MKFAICNETFQDWSFDRACAFAHQCGYTGLEIAPFTIAHDVQTISDSHRAQVRKQAEDEGLEIIGLHWLLAKTEGYHLTSPDESVRKRTAEYLSHLAEFCRDLGGSVMVFGSPPQRNLLPGVSVPEATDYAVDVFQQAMPVLEQCDVTLAVEPLAPAETDFLLTAAEATTVIERVASPHCRLHLDVKAMASESVPIPDVIRTNAQLLAHFHANDPNRQGPGFGDVEFVPIFEALGQIDYQGWVSVEVFDYDPGIERLAQESIRYMQECLVKLAESP